MPKTLLRKLLALIVPAALASLPATAQNVGINTSGAAPAASSLLDLDVSLLPANGKLGLLIPRMTAAERAALPGPVAGLLVYQVDDQGPLPGSYNPATSHGLWYYDGAAWVRIANVNPGAWLITGNNNTAPATNYLGTPAGSVDDLVFRTNNTARVTLSGTNGFVGLNTAPTEALSVAGALRTYKAAAPYSLTNNEGVIRFDPVVQQHEGNVTNGATGWRRLENRERLVVNEDYSGYSLNCPGTSHYTEGGLITGQTNSTAPARHQQTPFPTGATASSSGSRVQYLFLASELSAPPFNLCAGNFTEIAFILLDDDPLTPIPGAALDLQIKIQGTAAAFLTGIDNALNAAPVRFATPSRIVSAGYEAFVLTTPFNWNGTDNVIIEVNYKKAGILGTSPRASLTVNSGFPNVAYAYHTSNTVTPGYLFTTTPVFPPGLLFGVHDERPVVRIQGSVKNATPLTLNADVVQYRGGIMIGSTAWAAANYRGPGTVRAEQKVHDGGLIISDHVFDRYFDGEVRPEDVPAAADHTVVGLNDLEDYLAEHRHLPAMPSRSEWNALGKASLGEISTGIWETVETQALYITELERDLRVLEDMAFDGRMTEAELDRMKADVQRSPRLSDDQKTALLAQLQQRYVRSK